MSLNLQLTEHDYLENNWFWVLGPKRPKLGLTLCFLNFIKIDANLGQVTVTITLEIDLNQFFSNNLEGL